MNQNNEYSNYAYRHLELLSSVMRQLDTINLNMSNIYSNRSHTRTNIPNDLYNIPSYSQQNPLRQNRPYTSRRSTSNSTTTYATPNTTTTTLDNNVTNLATNILNSLFWDPVSVYPTQEEIENATSSVSFSDLNDNSSRCPITLEPFTENSDILRINTCGHCFTRSGITRWFRNHVSCPVCRHDIRGGINQTAGNDNENETENINNTQTLQFDFTINPTSTSNGSMMTFPLPPTYRNGGHGGPGGHGGHGGSTNI